VAVVDTGERRPPGRPPGGGRSPAESRQHILQVAKRCFAAKGVAATTMSDIAEAAGVNRVLIYRHFATRDIVVSGVLQQVAAELLGFGMRRAEGMESLVDLVVHGVAELVDMIRSDPLITAVFTGDDRSDALRMATDDTAVHAQVHAFITQLLAQMPDQVRVELRDDVPMEELVTHLVHVGSGLVAAPDRIAGSRESLERYLRLFILPSFARPT